MASVASREKRRPVRYRSGFGDTTKLAGLLTRARNIAVTGYIMPGIGLRKQTQMDLLKCLAAGRKHYRGTGEIGTTQTIRARLSLKGWVMKKLYTISGHPKSNTVL